MEFNFNFVVYHIRPDIIKGHCDMRSTPIFDLI